MPGPISITLLLLVASFILAFKQARFRPWERPLLWASLVVHALSAFAMVKLTRGALGGGDMLDYHQYGLLLGGQLETDFSQTAPRLLAMVFQQESNWLLLPTPNPSSTSSMAGIAGWMVYLLGPSLYAHCICVSMATFFAKLGIYRVFRASFESSGWRSLLVVFMLTPSVVFWSSGLIKESIAFIGMGLAISGGYRVVNRRSPFAFASLAAGVVIMGISKAYLLIPLFGAGALWYYWTRAKRLGGGRTINIRPVHFLVAAGLGVLLITGVGQVFPRFNLSQIADEIAHLQEVGSSVEGGSNYSIGDSSERSLAGQLAFVPQALVNGLLRPVVFEARNIPMLVNSLEMLVVTLLAVFLLVRRGVRGTLRVISSSPELVFCLAFVFSVAVGVGLSTTNLGTLSRYRMPMMPFYVGMLLFVRPGRPTNRRSRAAAPADPGSPGKVVRLFDANA